MSDTNAVNALDWRALQAIDDPMSISKLVVLTAKILERAGVERKPGWIIRRSKEYFRQELYKRKLLTDYILECVRLSDVTRSVIENDPSERRPIELLMTPGIYAGRDHRSRIGSVRHEAGRVPNEHRPRHA